MPHPPLKLPRLYAIVDAGRFTSERPAASPPLASHDHLSHLSSRGGRAFPGPPASADFALGGVDAPDEGPAVLQAITTFTRALATAGVTLVQYRNKHASAREILSHARELRRVLPPTVTFFLNDRADLAVAAGCDGVHVGQDDLSPEGARLVVGERYVGVSTHNPAQLELADRAPVDYIAIGPIFSTRSKANPDPVVGLDGLRAVRKLTTKPLVAIGGITRENCRSVIDAGADSVAVIADLLADPHSRAEEFLSILAR